MSELIQAVLSWRLLLVAIAVYGFAPGFLLRIIVRLYPHDDDRRQELVAELYTVPRLWRPLWVAEQLETGLFEGLAARWSASRSRPDTVEAWLDLLMTLGSRLFYGAMGCWVGYALLFRPDLREEALTRARTMWSSWPSYVGWFAGMTVTAISLGALGVLLCAWELRRSISVTWRNAIGSVIHTLLLDEPVEGPVPFYVKVFVYSLWARRGDEVHTLLSAVNLATVYLAAGHFDGRAVPFYEDTFARCRRVFGDDDRHTLNAANNLAAAYQDADRLDQALPLYEAIYGRCGRVLGDDHPDTVTSARNLAAAHHDARRRAEMFYAQSTAYRDAPPSPAPGAPHHRPPL